MVLRGIFAIAMCILLSGVSDCDKNDSKKNLAKIDFSHEGINDQGMQNDVPVDYEFCIPKDEEKVAEVKSIEPGVTIPRMAKGRIGCSEEQYLCIVSSREAGWKKRLYRIASLPYVKKIIQTDYE